MGVDSFSFVSRTYVMECLPRISHLLHSIFNSDPPPPPPPPIILQGKEELVVLPDDILIDILSRLPARAVQHCRAVCRRWRVLTSSILFVGLQAQRAPPVVLVQGLKSRHQRKSLLYIYDEISNKLRRVPFGFGTYGGMRLPFLYGAFGPLLHLKGSKLRWGSRYLITNPDICECDLVLNLVTRKVHVLPKLDDNGVVYVSALYFHNPTNEYKCLCMRYLSADQSPKYYSYSLASRTLKEIAQSRFTSSVTSNTYPVAFNNALHFTTYTYPAAANIRSDHNCGHAVLVFDMDSEKMHTLPHPEFDCPCPEKSRRDNFMRLFVHDGHLALCHVHKLATGLFDIWLLEDYEHWHWVRKSRFSLGRWGLTSNTINMLALSCFMVSSLGKDELFIDWFSGLLLVANLKELTIKEIQVPSKLKSSEFRRCVAYPSIFGTPHLS